MLKKKFVALAVAALMTGTMFTGCGSSKTASESLTIWSKVTDEERVALEKHSKAWGDKNGYEVKVLNDDGGYQDFLQAANSSKSPDLYIGMPHDTLANFQTAGILSEVPASFDKTGYTTETLWDATSFGGKNYAVPFAQETVALLYNKDKMPEVPETMEELIKVAKAHGPSGFQVDLGNFFITGGIVQTMGGYIFGGESGNLDPTDIGLANAGSVAAYQFLQDLVQKEKLMPADIKGDIIASNFKSGETIAYISGSWDIAQMKEAGINVGVAEIPSIAGNPYRSFLGVQTGFVLEKSSKKDKAWELMEYLNTEMAADYYTAGGRMPARQSVIDAGLTKEDPYFEEFLKQSKNAIPMPNVIEMQAVWNATANISRVVNGEDPQTVGNDIVSGIQKGIETQQ